MVLGYCGPDDMLEGGSSASGLRLTSDNRNNDKRKHGQEGTIRHIWQL